MRKVIAILIIVLAIAHQDFWLWDDDTLVFRFIPIGLAYHALYSLSCAVVWAMVVKFAWPSEIERFANLKENDETANTSRDRSPS